MENLNNIDDLFGAVSFYEKKPLSNKLLKIIHNETGEIKYAIKYDNDLYCNGEKINEYDYSWIYFNYHRPKTRGELVDKIKEGVPCEVVSMIRQFTCICLDGWLKMEGKYKIRQSENMGWDIYELI